jgi:hypothetical protein
MFVAEIRYRAADDGCYLLLNHKIVKRWQGSGIQTSGVSIQALDARLMPDT